MTRNLSILLIVLMCTSCSVSRHSKMGCCKKHHHKSGEMCQTSGCKEASSCSKEHHEQCDSGSCNSGCEHAGKNKAMCNHA